MNRRQKKPSNGPSSSNVTKLKGEMKPASEGEKFLQDFFRIFGKGMYLLCILSLVYFLYYAYTAFIGPNNSTKPTIVSCCYDVFLKV